MGNATSVRFQTTQKGSLWMMEYILKTDSCDNLATIKEPIAERDQILQLLRGLREDCKSIVAFLTTHVDDVHIHSIHGMLLTHEQHLCFQNSIAEGDNISSSITATKGRKKTK